MGRFTMTALRVSGAATIGATAAAGYAIVSGLAFNALSRGLEIGAIPLLLAAFGAASVIAFDVLMVSVTFYWHA
jgi:hypothetical protein